MSINDYARFARRAEGRGAGAARVKSAATAAGEIYKYVKYLLRKCEIRFASLRKRHGSCRRFGFAELIINYAAGSL